METASLTQLQLQLIFSPTWLPRNTQTSNTDTRRFYSSSPSQHSERGKTTNSPDSAQGEQGGPAPTRA